jgi:hypothetical protein
VHAAFDGEGVVAERQGLAGGLDGGEEQPDERADDGDYYEQFDESKTV